jgi:hypothetical protein
MSRPTSYVKKSDEPLALACGASVEAAARQCQGSNRTVYRRLGDPKFCARVREMRAEMVGRAAGLLSAGEAVRTLLSLQKESVAPAVRLGAARAVLELGIKVREMVELETRIAALEEQAGLAGGRMRLTSRVRKLEGAVPKCDGRISRIVHGTAELTEADRCRLCGGCHVLVVHEVIVEAGSDGPVPPSEATARACADG